MNGTDDGLCTYRASDPMEHRSTRARRGVFPKAAKRYEGTTMLGEAAALERLKVLRTEGLGFDRIAARMNEERIPSRAGKPWQS